MVLEQKHSLCFFQFCSVAAVDVLVEHPLETFMMRELWNLSREFFSLINYIEGGKKQAMRENIRMVKIISLKPQTGKFREGFKNLSQDLSTLMGKKMIMF